MATVNDKDKQIILLQGGRLIDPLLNLDQPGDVLIKEGRIAAIGANLTQQASEVFPAKGLIICPGLVDMHVHFRSPGDEQKEDLASGSAAAAAGGFTAVACEPNTHPILDSGVMVRQLIEKANLLSHIYLYVKGCLTLAGLGDEVVDVAEMKAYGACALSSDGDPVENAAVMSQALAECRKHGLLPTLHEEASGRLPLTENSHCREPELVRREVLLAAENRSPVHFSHISTVAAVETIRLAKLHGMAVTAEVTPHHLSLCAEDAPFGNANFKVNPPLRSRTDREAMKKALATGIIDCIATDHAPHTPDEKAAGYEAAPFGVIGLETSLGVALTELYHTGMMSLQQIITAMSVKPRKLLSLPDVCLAEDFPADITLFDPDLEWPVDPQRFHSKGRNCPFAGRLLKGRPIATIVAGRFAMKHGQIT